MKIDVITLGHSNIDYLGVVPFLPDLDSKIEMSDFAIQGGGPAATAAVTCARLGAKTAYVGAMGEDDFADFMIRDFEREGVDVSHVIRHAGARSQFSFIMVDEKTGKRTIIWTRSGIPSLSADFLDKDFFSSCKVLHLDRHEIPASICAAKWVHEAGGIVSLDAGTYAPEIEDLLPFVDVLIASQKFARDAVGDCDPAVCARELLCDRMISGVTCGENGSFFSTSEYNFAVPAFRVDVVDTTGAGDVYHGAFAFGLAKGWDARRCAEFASAVAAIKCTKLGGRAGIPTLIETEEFIRIYKTT